MEPVDEIDRDDLRTGVPGARSRKALLIRAFLWYNVSLLFQRRIVSPSVIEDQRVEMRAFVFPGQGGGVSEPAPEMVPEIQRVVGERIPDQVKIFVRAARDADESRTLKVHPDVVAGHSLGEYGAAYAAGCFDLDTGLWLVAQRDHFLAEAARECPGGMVAILRTDPAEVEKALGGPGGPVVANYNSPRQTVVSGLRDAVREALKDQMVAPVRWVRVVETLAKMRVEEWIELGGGRVLTRMLKDFELPSLNGITFEDLRARLYGQAQNLLPRKEGE